MGKQLNVENSVISAKDDALFYNAMLQKNGVWQYGNKLDYEIISANQINIKDGMLTAQGRNYVIYPNEVDSLTIENGTVNTKRNDLIVYEVSKTSEGEQVGLKVIKGTSATTPTDPILIQENTLVSGSKYQMPLYRVRLNGINIEGVDDLREYIVSFGNLVNDNLLINSDFRNPVNQRWQMSYWKPSSWTYSVDRWTHIYNSVILEDVYIRIYNDSGETGTTFFKQIFERPLEQNDYTVTVNVKEINGTVQVEGFDTLVKGLNVFTIKNTSLSQLQLNLVGESSVELYYIKLERGSIATPFVPRPYGEELALCQRYYLIMVETSMIITRQRFDSNISYYSGFVLPNEVRTVGTATYESRTPDGIVLTGELQAIIDRRCVNYFNIWGDYPNVEITKFVIDAEIY